MIKTTDGTNYLSIIKNFKARIVSYNDIIENKYDDRVMVIRHDVDETMESAIKLAKHEHKNKIKSIYFLLDSNPYFNKSQKFKEQCQELLDLGHEIGWHNDTIATHIKKGTKFKQIIERALEVFDYHGIEVEFVTAHGGRYMSLNKIGNNHIWNHNPRRKESVKIIWSAENDYYRKTSKMKIPGFNINDFGIKESVCLLKKNAFLGDGGGNIRAQFYGPKRRGTIKFSDYNKVYNEVVHRFNKLKRGWAELLFHPHWWR